MTVPPLQRNQSDRDCGHGVECGRCTRPDKDQNFSTAERKELKLEAALGGQGGQPRGDWSHVDRVPQVTYPSHPSLPETPQPMKRLG